MKRHLSCRYLPCSQNISIKMQNLDNSPGRTPKLLILYSLIKNHSIPPAGSFQKRQAPGMLFNSMKDHQIPGVSPSTLPGNHCGNIALAEEIAPSDKENRMLRLTSFFIKKLKEFSYISPSNSSENFYSLGC